MIFSSRLPAPFLLLLALGACSPAEADPDRSTGSGLEAASEPEGSATENGAADGNDGGSPEAANADAATSAKPKKEPILVRVGDLEVRSVEKVLEATADVISLDEVNVFPESTQPVVELLVEEGDQVQQGQLLARLRSEMQELSLADAKVRLREAEDAHQRAKTDYDRDRSLMESSQDLETSLISERELETSKMALVTAATTLESAKVTLDRAEFELRQTEIRAPIDGTVALREISLGDMANPAAMAFRLVDQSHPKAVFYRPQRELALLHIGQELTATCEAMPDVEIRGRVERISPTVNATSGTVKVTASLEAEKPIPIGVLVRLRLILDRHEDALMVPKKALLYEGDDIFCFAVRDGRAVRAAIRCGFEEPDCMEVLSGEGGDLQPGDQVVLVGADRLADGDPVELAEDV